MTEKESAGLAGKLKFNVETEKIEGPPAAEFTIGDLRDPEGRECRYQGGYDPAYRYVETAWHPGSRVRLFIRDGKADEPGADGLTVR